MTQKDKIDLVRNLMDSEKKIIKMYEELIAGRLLLIRKLKDYNSTHNDYYLKDYVRLKDKYFKREVKE